MSGGGLVTGGLVAGGLVTAGLVAGGLVAGGLVWAGVVACGVVLTEVPPGTVVAVPVLDTVVGEGVPLWPGMVVVTAEPAALAVVGVELLPVLVFFFCVFPTGPEGLPAESSRNDVFKHSPLVEGAGPIANARVRPSAARPPSVRCKLSLPVNDGSVTSAHSTTVTLSKRAASDLITAFTWICAGRKSIVVSNPTGRGASFTSSLCSVD